jgi:hypothetical protein
LTNNHAGKVVPTQLQQTKPKKQPKPKTQPKAQPPERLGCFFIQLQQPKKEKNLNRKIVSYLLKLVSIC